MLGRIGRLAATVFGAAAVVVAAMVIADVWRHGLPDISVASLLRILRGGEPGPAIERSLASAPAAGAKVAPPPASVASTSEAPAALSAAASPTSIADPRPAQDLAQVPGPLRAAASTGTGGALAVSDAAPAAEPPPVPFPALANVAVSSAPGAGPAPAHGGRNRPETAAPPAPKAAPPVSATVTPASAPTTSPSVPTVSSANAQSAGSNAKPFPAQAASPAPASAPSPVAAVRDVTAPGMTRLVQPTGPLIRIDSPKPASAADTAETAPAKRRDPEVPQVLRLAIVEDGVTLRSGALRVKLAGLRPIDTDQTCRTAAGIEWPCGRQATLALRLLMRGRSPACVLADGIKDGTTVGLCRLGAQDVSEWMVRQGWAYAATPDLAEAEADAREHKRGAFALDLPAAAPQTSAGVVAPMPGMPLEGVTEQPWEPAPSLASRDAAAPKPTGTP